MGKKTDVISPTEDKRTKPVVKNAKLQSGVDKPGMPQKKKKLTSWQRRRKASGVPEAGPHEAALNRACAEAKAASEEARSRFLNKEEAQPGDPEVSARYSAAKLAMRTWHQTKASKAAQKPPKAVHPPSGSKATEEQVVPKLELQKEGSQPKKGRKIHRD